MRSGRSESSDDFVLWWDLLPGECHWVLFIYRLLQCKETEEHGDRKRNCLRTYQAKCFSLSALKHHPFDHFSLPMLAISAGFHSVDTNYIICGPRPKEKRNPSSICIASLQRYTLYQHASAHHVEMFTGVGYTGCQCSNLHNSRNPAQPFTCVGVLTGGPHVEYDTWH